MYPLSKQYSVAIYCNAIKPVLIMGSSKIYTIYNGKYGYSKQGNKMRDAT